MSCSSMARQASGPSSEHPCYSAHGQHQYARIHLAVAPACNIQCNYCNRRYDCSNESRPGVTSMVLTPQQAAARVASVAQRLPNLKVVGIAGPGDPLANGARTLETLKRVKEVDPSLLLCVSTNGLALADHAEALAAIGVHHLTITVNTLDLHTAARIYAWVYRGHRRWHGLAAARELLAAQLDGLRAAVASGMQVKINSVVIPGINDSQVVEVAEMVRQHGAVLHNLMPLISKPEHGTWFGLNHQREPDAELMTRIKSAVRPIMPLMEHCQQCRADAVGMLGNNENLELPAVASQPQPLLKVAVASSDGRVVDRHLGHARTFHIWARGVDGKWRLEASRELPAYCDGPVGCDAEAPADEQQRAAPLLAAVGDCQLLLACRVGDGPRQLLAQAGVEVNCDLAWHTVDDALARVAAATAATPSARISA